MRPLQTYLLFLWRPHVHSLDAVIPLTSFFKRHLRWWALESRYTEGVPTLQVSDYRCFAGGVGGSPRSSRGGVLRSLVSGDQATTHQRTGAPGSLAEPPGSSQVSDRLLCSGSVGQFNSCRLPEQTGGHQIGSVMSSYEADSLVVPRSQGRSVGHSYLGQVECFGRLPFQGIGPGAKRVGVRSDNVQCGSGQVGQSVVGSVLNQGEPQTATVCVSNAGSSCLGSRRSSVLMAEAGCLRVSSVCSDPQDTGESPEGRGSGHSDRPVLALQELVQSSNRSAGRASSQATSVRSTAVTTRRKSTLSKRGKTLPSRLEVIRQSVRRDGFSAEAAEVIAKCRRTSTTSLYDARWRIWGDWCLQREINPVEPSLGQIGDFLLHLFRVKKLSVSAIKGYRSALAIPLLSFLDVRPRR